jgi:hypothetical protein
VVVVFRASPLFIMDKELRPSSSQNDITGDHIITKVSNETYRSGWDRIFGKKKEENPPDGSKGYYDWSEEKPPNKWIR